MKHKLDSQDKNIVIELTRDGAAPVAKIAETLGVTAPTIRTRIKNLLHKGILCIAGLVDPERTQGVTVAMVCLTLESHSQLDDKLAAIAKLDMVTWAGVVTGRYDIMVEILISDDITDLYRFLDRDLSTIGGIASSESFVVMKSKKKWVRLPEGALKRLNLEQR